MDRLKKLRDRVDWLDRHIALLLNERMMAANQIGRVKRDHQLNITDSCREDIVLQHVASVVQHPVLQANIANIYQEILREARVAQQFFQHSCLPFRRIGIIGLGLIGGSIAKGIKVKDPSVEISQLMCTQDEGVRAQEDGWIDQQCKTMCELVEQEVELIILASPLSTIISWAEKIAHSCQRPLLVIDVASVKNSIVATFETLSCPHVEYLGTHPMAGKETCGWAHSQATLFVGSPWVLTPHKQNSVHAIESVEALVRFLGAEPMRLEAKVHDRQAALISHLPSLISKSYFEFVHAIDSESMAISGPGFQSFTRLAHESQNMCTEIAHYNHEYLQHYLIQWLNYVTKKGVS